MATHLWQIKNPSKKTLERLNILYNQAQAEGFTKRESMRWATHCVERNHQGNFKYMRCFPKTHLNNRWLQGATIHASEYLYCRLMKLPQLPRCPHEPEYDGKAGIAVTAHRIQKYYGHYRIAKFSAQALRNLQTIAGPTGLYNTQAHCAVFNSSVRDLIISWAAYKRGRDLFIPGIGGFDIKSTINTLTDFKNIEPINIIGIGYAHKFNYHRLCQIINPTMTKKEMCDLWWDLSRKSKQYYTILINVHTRNHYLRNREFWNNNGHIDLLTNATAAELQLPPERLIAALEYSDSEDLDELVEYPYPKALEDFTTKEYTIKPIRDNQELRMVADKLHNCAAGYHTQLTNRNQLLLTCYHSSDLDKPLALANLTRYAITYDQVYGPCNKKPTKAISEVYNQALPYYLTQRMTAITVPDPITLVF